MTAPGEPPLSNAAPAADPSRTRAAAVQLVRLLSEFDGGAADFVEANSEALRPLFPGDSWPQFEQLIQSYALSDAQEQLEQALKRTEDQ